MSLIHKALKKAEGVEGEGQKGPPPPTEEFIGAKGRGFGRIPARTIILLVAAVLAVVFMVYKKFHTSGSLPPIPPNMPVSAEPTPTPSLPPPATTALAGGLGGGGQSPTNLPDNALLEEGKKLYAAGRLDDALAKFHEALEGRPQDPVVFNNLGLVYKKKNDLSKAEDYYKKALELKPDYPECLNNLGVLNAAKGNPLEAAILLKKAVGINKTYADAYFNLAVLNDGEGNWREAISNYKFFLQYTDTDDESFITKVKGRVEQLSE